ncbi:MAG: transporter substrate-binding domain-containing protein, partial [Pyramidobacter sp.]|nr:transporter substrate-binding domain-containing protein [Pyramidobacter sp.]
MRCLDHLAPYVFTGPDGRLAGAYIEMLETIARHAQLRFYVETGQPENDNDVPDLLVGSMFPVAAGDKLYGALSVRNFDPDDPRMARSVTRMLDSVVEDQQEALCFAFPFLWESSSLFVPQGSADRLENLRGRRICVVLGSPEESFLRKLGYDKELFLTTNVAEGMRTLSLRICDAFVCETFQGTYELGRVSRLRYAIRQRTLPLQSYDRAIVVLRGNMELAVKIGHALREIRQSGRYTQILDRWLNDHEEYYLTPRFVTQVSCGVLAVILIMAVWNHVLARKIRVTIGERERIFDFLREGILAVDAHGKITMLNRMAKTLLGLSNDAFGKSADELIPDLDIGAVLRTGTPVYDAEQNLRGSLLSCSTAPVVVDERVSGAIVTLRDLSELQAMAEEMTGVKMYFES